MNVYLFLVVMTLAIIFTSAVFTPLAYVLIGLFVLAFVPFIFRWKWNVLRF